MYFDRNISENKYGKKMRAVICLVYPNGEFYSKETLLILFYYAQLAYALE